MADDSVAHEIVISAQKAPGSISFDYGSIDPSAAAVARYATTRIKGTMRESIVEIGKALLSARDALPHGSFGSWLKAEFGWSDRTARNYMMAAEWSEANSEIIADLPPTVVIELAAPSTPEPARVEIVEQVRKGVTVSVKGVKEIIRREKDKEKVQAAKEAIAARRAKMTPEEIKKFDRSKAAKEKRAAEHERQILELEEAKRVSEENAQRLADIIAPFISNNREAARLLRSEILTYRFIDALKKATKAVRA